MKKILFLITSLLLLTGCSKGKLSEISYNEFKTKLDNKEEFVLVIGRASCGHCLDYKETLNKVFEKYKVTLYYVDLDSAFNKRYIGEEYNFEKENLKFKGTCLI